MSLVLILRVFRVRRIFRGSIFFSLVLILHIRAYLGIKGDNFFSNCIRSICTKTNTNLLHTNLKHSILRKN